MSKVKLTLEFGDANDVQLIISLYHALTCEDHEWADCALDLLPNALGYLSDRMRENLVPENFSWSDFHLSFLKQSFGIGEEKDANNNHS